MRIALITSGERGPGSYSRNLFQALKRRNHDVLVVSTTRWFKGDVDALYVAKSWLAFGLAPTVFRVRELVGAIESFRPDIVHCQWPSGTVDQRFGEILQTGIPAIATFHVSVDSRGFLWDRVFSWHFGKFIPFLSSLRALISISAFVKGQVERRAHTPGVPHHLVHTGLDENVFAPAPRVEDDTLKVLFVGQIMPEKGIDALVEAFLKVQGRRRATLTIIGQGHLKRYLQRKTRDLESVRWVGFVGSPQEIAMHYSQADLTILPTRWEEAFSLVPVESMACGTPVLATRKGGNPEIVIPGESGFLIERCDGDEIANALLSVRLAELRAMRPQCRALVLQRHTLGQWGDAHEKIYSEALR